MVTKTEENKAIRQALGAAGIRTVSTKHTKSDQVIVIVQRRIGEPSLSYTHAKWRENSGFMRSAYRIVSSVVQNFRLVEETHSRVY